MKCITCDNEEATIHGQCEHCFIEHLQVSTTGSIEVTICPKCASFKIGNSWSHGKLEKPLTKKINEHLLISDPSVIVEADSNSVELKRLEGKITFSTLLQTSDRRIPGNQQDISAKILLNSCPTCNKITGSYYESIIQLRTLTAEFSPIIEKVLKEIAPMLEKLNQSDNDSFVSKIEQVKAGVDIYLGKKNDGIKISKYIHDHYFSNTTTTKKLNGRREGEDFYRHTYLVRLFNLPPGTIIYGKTRTYILEKVSSNSLTVIEPRNEKRYEILQNDFNTGAYSYSNQPLQERKFIVVSTEKGESTAMDQINFEVLTLKGEYEGDVTAVDYDGKLIVINR